MTDLPEDPMQRLLAIMVCLRDPESGCPWDVEQDFRSIAPYTIEEAYEVADAIERGDLDELRDELGDLLLQVVFHARMAEEQGAFGFRDVAKAISDKMVRRHPHVFAGADTPDVDEQSRNWEAIKAAERARKSSGGEREGEPSAIDDVSVALPGLPRAVKLTRRAARVGFDWPDAGGVFAKIREELGELEEAWARGEGERHRVEEELGDLLFATANLARHLQIDPETALRGTIGRFEGRFRGMERELGADGTSVAEVSFSRREAAWEAAKRREHGSGEMDG